MRILEPVYLSGFQSLRPRYERNQAEALEWLAEAHALAEDGAAQGIEETRKKISRLLHKLGCGPGRINSRGSELSDFTHRDWARMRLFRMDLGKEGIPAMDARMSFFDEAADGILERFYGEEAEPPSDLIHVTCTGYVAPSAAQKLVARRGWGASTAVTHAYHMGCYAAVPAVRLAAGQLAAGSRRADIVHTELCSLHVDPLARSPERLVIESLFADGFIRYSAGRDPVAGFRVLATREELVPETEDAMRWRCASSAMEMTLAREVPSLIAGALPGFVSRLREDAGISPGEPVFHAIHPGGPKIIDQVAALLEVPEEGKRWSAEVLRECGNMSSATLPHIWQRMLADKSVPAGATLLSLAFGPGLSLCGCVLRKTA